MKTVELREKSQKNRGYTYKITISATNCQRIANIVLN